MGLSGVELHALWNTVAGLLRPQPSCPACGHQSRDLLCPACSAAAGLGRLHPVAPGVVPAADRAWYLADYRTPQARLTPVATLVLRFKYRRDRLAGHAIARLVARGASLLPARYDVVTAVPLHKRRLLERGYNQAAWLARAAARPLRARVRPALLRRTRSGRAQVGSSRSERRRNATGSFACTSADLGGARVLLVDDVLTTGATLTAAAAALRICGAGRVDALTVCAVTSHRSGPLPGDA
ncbi:MAG: ComF family protein [Deltaproteobacteria bacterium]|nr:MAG: ComF family protein [Deltaproteobacteria bacterium]